MPKQAYRPRILPVPVHRLCQFQVVQHKVRPKRDALFIVADRIWQRSLRQTAIKTSGKHPLEKIEPAELIVPATKNMIFLKIRWIIPDGMLGVTLDVTRRGYPFFVG